MAPTGEPGPSLAVMAGEWGVCHPATPRYRSSPNQVHYIGGYISQEHPPSAVISTFKRSMERGRLMATPALPDPRAPQIASRLSVIMAVRWLMAGALDAKARRACLRCRRDQVRSGHLFLPLRSAAMLIFKLKPAKETARENGRRSVTLTRPPRPATVRTARLSARQDKSSTLY